MPSNFSPVNESLLMSLFNGAGTSECVTSETDCPAGTELRIVGRHGKPECVARM